MAGAELIFDIAVIFGALIRILDHQLNRRTGRLALKDTRKNLYLIRLSALSDIFACPGFPQIQPMLQGRFIHLDPRRTAVHRAAKRWPVAFAPSRDAKEMTDCLLYTSPSPRDRG